MSAVETTPAESRRRSFLFLPGPAGPTPGEGTPLRRRRLLPAWVPYSLASPALLVLAGIIGVPVALTLLFSFQHYGSFELIQGLPGRWVGFNNYEYLLGQGDLPAVLLRTLFFTIATVGLTMLIGFALALLMRRASRPAQVFLTVSLVVVWAMPMLASSQLFLNLFDSNYGVVAWLLSALHINFPNAHHDWWATGQSLLTVATIIVVWGAVPFVALSLFAGLLQIPDELYEAARVDGAGFFGQMRLVTVPLLLPIILLLTTLSIIWDSGVFTQVYILEQHGGELTQSEVLGVFAYQVGFASNDYGMGAAVGMFATALLAIVSFFAIRQMVKSTGPA
jgi:N,N'-diacetylchitobiose transport system permease protein